MQALPTARLRLRSPSAAWPRAPCGPIGRGDGFLSVRPITAPLPTARDPGELSVQPERTGRRKRLALLRGAVSGEPPGPLFVSRRALRESEPTVGSAVQRVVE